MGRETIPALFYHPTAAIVVEGALPPAPPAIVDSIRKTGIFFSTLVVTAREDRRLVLVAGRDRLAAALACRLETVPVIVVPLEVARRITILENLARRGMSWEADSVLIDQLRALEAGEPVSATNGHPPAPDAWVPPEDLPLSGVKPRRPAARRTKKGAAA